jgi:spermidine synthase
MTEGRVGRLVLGALFFASGAAGLIYQVVWVRELGLIFGATAEAAAAGVAVFFAGLAIGARVFGKHAARIAAPLRVFGLVQLGVAATALLHFVMADAWFALYPRLHLLLGPVLLAEILAKLAVAATLLMPSAVLMGGTLPLLAQHMIRRRAELGRTGASLYALNTAGGAAGALAAGFVLPPLMGFAGTYLLAVGLDAATGLAALAIAGRSMARPQAVRPMNTQRLPPALAACAALSGAATLAVEVAWTRLFAQVLQNSVYTYALVLAAFLAALALGAAAARALAGWSRWPPDQQLVALLLCCAMLAATMPLAFHAATDGLAYLGHDQDFAGYVVAVGRALALLVLLPGAVLGAVLPLLLRLVPAEDGDAGGPVGRLVALNTWGAVAGALGAGFVLLPLLGAYGIFAAAAAAYLLLAAWLLPAAGRARAAPRLAGAGLAMAVLLFRPDLPVIWLDIEGGERLIEAREGRAASVAVVGIGRAVVIRVNTHYTLGGSGTLAPERNQALIPLLLHPAPRRVFFLGLGTGITAGAALFDEPEQVTVCELLPEVVALARRHFAPYANGLFEEPRVAVHAEDGRHCLARSRAPYDVIISDLFTPWEAGTGNLFTVETYRLAAQRLAPGGVFVQWVPLYQVSRAELATIAMSMAAAFGEVTLWRGDTFAGDGILALVGRAEPAPLDPAMAGARWAALTGQPADEGRAAALALYVGNLASGVFAGAPRNTLDRPVIEFAAPRTQRAAVAGTARFLVGMTREALFAEFATALPPEADRLLSRLSAADLAAVRAGRLRGRWLAAAEDGQAEQAEAAREALLTLVPTGLPWPGTPAEALGVSR